MFSKWITGRFTSWRSLSTPKNIYVYVLWKNGVRCKRECCFFCSPIAANFPFFLKFIEEVLGKVGTSCEQTILRKGITAHFGARQLLITPNIQAVKFIYHLSHNNSSHQSGSSWTHWFNNENDFVILTSCFSEFFYSFSYIKHP